MKQHFFKLILIISLHSLNIIACGQVVEFQKIFSGDSIPVGPYTFFDIGYSVENTANNGYIIGGTQGKYAGYDYSYGKVINLNHNGDTLWTSVFGSGKKSTRVNAIKETSDNCFILTGVTQYLNSQSGDMLLVKLDSNGNIIWSKIYGDSLSNDGGLDVLQTNDNGYVFAGYTQAHGSGGRDVCVLKTNSNGDTLWTKIIGGISDEEAQKIKITKDNGFLILGYTKSYGAGNEDAFVIKLDSLGNLEWSKTFGTIGYEFMASFALLQNDTIVIAGNTNNDLFLLKITPQGDSILWAKKIGTAGSDFAYDMELTNDNGFVIAGSAYGGVGYGVPKMYFVKTDFNGDTICTKAYGVVGEEAHSVRQTPDGGFALVGVTSYVIPGGNGDIYFVKTDAYGNSGCYERGTASFEDSMSMQIGNPIPQINFGGRMSNVTFNKTQQANVVTVCTTVGLSEIYDVNYSKIYPNPFNQRTTLEFENPQKENCILTLYNSQGSLIRTISNIKEEKIVIERMTLTSGLYLFQLQTDIKVIAKGKIIIE